MQHEVPQHDYSIEARKVVKVDSLNLRIHLLNRD